MGGGQFMIADDCNYEDFRKSNLGKPIMLSCLFCGYNEISDDDRSVDCPSCRTFQSMMPIAIDLYLHVIEETDV